MIKLSFSDLNVCGSAPDEKREQTTHGEVHTLEIENEDSDEHEFIEDLCTKASDVGLIIDGHTKHLYTRGAFDLVDLVLYVLKQTGPADVFISSYGIAVDSMQTIRRCLDTGKILSVRFLIDNRVRSISPKPFDYMVRSFPGMYKCNSVHAKCALISNDKWRISIIGSQNATHNPKLERDTIYTDARVFEFDRENLERAFEEGTS